MPSPKEPLVFGCYVDIELTIDGEHHGARSISFSEPTADVPMGPKHIGKLPYTIDIKCTADLGDFDWAAFARRLFHLEERECCGEQFGWVSMPTSRLAVKWDEGEQEEIPIESITERQTDEDLIVDMMGWPHGPGPFERKAWCELYLAFWEALHGCPSPQP